MGPIRRRLGWRVADVVAFVFTVAIGLAMGGVLSIGEALEERFKGDERHAARQVDKRS